MNSTIPLAVTSVLTLAASITLSACSDTSVDDAAADMSSAATDSAVVVTVTAGQAPEANGVASATSEISEGPASTVDPCTAELLAAGSPDGWVTLYCDFGWARIAPPQSDGMSLLQWTGRSWSRVEPSGETFTGFDCYDRTALVAEGAPDTLFGNITVC